MASWGVAFRSAAFAAVLSLTSWACAAAPHAPAGAHGAGAAALDRPAAHAAVLAQSAREGRVVVALFSLDGCAWCEALRTDHLRHLAREADARRLRVVEYDIGDRRPFAARSDAANAPASPAALADALQVRVAPTLVFLGPDGGEIAERLVGYPSPDFYGAYLEQRITKAHQRLADGH